MARSQKLVFRWVGKSIEGSPSSRRKYLNDTQREEYLRYIDDALTVENGLFATPYTDEYLGRIISKKTRKKRGIWQLGSDLPCLSFTEVDLGDCAEHRAEYGRLAFGFTKQFILKEGGSTMQYVLGTKSCNVVRDIKEVAKSVDALVKSGARGAEGVLSAFRRLMHFYKRVRPIVSDRNSPDARMQKNEKPQRKTKFVNALDGTREAREAGYARLNKMAYLEEHEWRLVYDGRSTRWRKDGENAWFQVAPGTELQMVIVPDNRTVQRIQQCDVFTDRLYKYPRKPVQVISLEALVRV